MVFRKDVSMSAEVPRFSRGAEASHTGADVHGAAGPVMAGSLAWRLAKGELGAALSFAGQGANCLPELVALARGRAHLRPWLELAQETVESMLGERAFAWSGLYAHGFAPLRWVDAPDASPSEAYLTSSAISQPLIFVTQIARYLALREEGLDVLMRAGAVRALTGHSQGMMPALLVAESEGGEIAPERFAEYVRYFVWQGLCMARSFAALGGASGQAGGDAEATPMAAISGLSVESLEGVLERVNARLAPERRVTIALYNTRSRHVVSGPSEALVRLRDALDARAASQRERKRRGRFAGRVEAMTWEFLAVGAAFHSPYMRQGLERMLECVERMGFELPAEALKLPVHSPADGVLFNATNDLTRALVTAQFVRSVRWPAVADALVARGDVDVVLELGPGESAARLLGSCVRGSGVQVVALSSDAGQRALWTAGAFDPAAGLRYAAFAPRLISLPSGDTVLDNRYTRLTGHSPMILPGMTPTTADAEIVAAAANAGFTAELAGGGQVTEAVFAERLRELRERLVPGAEVVFNALYLDPYLWGLHLGKTRLVQQARRAGAPIRGVTISAGIPEVSEAVRLLDELEALGIWHNAFKPGTVAQIRQVVRIAQAAPERTIFAHVEGGRAGGHHSWEDLEQLLLEGYHALRAQPNVVLCVGGGVGTPERAADLLSGRWAQAHGLRPMPVDAVLLGTVTMACAEAQTSPQVKQALVEAAGTDAWVLSGDSAGQVTSGRSQLNADIHYLDNAAARCGRLLDEVAGDAEAVEAKRDAIIEALNATAKPYFGDVGRMTYLQVLERMVELMAIGQGGRYEDGPWLDVSWRARVADMVRRTEARLSEADEGTFPSVLGTLDALDRPAEVLSRVAERYPEAASRLVHPLDEDFFVALCRRPGKPVNFVPVLDADVRRWYKADSLWQAHDARYSADQVLAIPGPEALRGVVRADEPVAELLGRFEQALVERLVGEGVAPVPARSRALVPGAALPLGLEREHADNRVILRAHDPERAPAWLDYIAHAFSGLIPALAGARHVYDERRCAWPNPMHALCVPTARAALALELDDHGAPTALCWSEAGHAERVRVRALGDDRVVFEIEIDGLDAGETPAVYRRVLAYQGDAFVEQTAERAAALRTFYHHALFGEDLEPAPLFEVARGSVTVDAERLEAYAALTQAAPGDDVPLNAAFSLVWRPMMRALSCDALAGGLLDLVHLSHAVDAGPAWPPVPGEALVATAQVTRLEDSAQGRAVSAEAELVRGGVLCARVRAQFWIRGDFGAETMAVQAREAFVAPVVLRDEAAVAYLSGRPWLALEPGVELSVGDALELDVVLREARPRDGEGRFEAEGVLRRDAVAVAVVGWRGQGAWDAHPVRVAARLLEPEAPRSSVKAKTLAVEEGVTPAAMEAFAQVSQDRNPIHRSALMARVAELSEPIVHGMWTAARMHGVIVREVAGGVAARVLAYEARFVAPALRGERLVVTARRVGAREGRLVVEAVAEVVRGAQRVVVAQASAQVRAPKTAYVLPGQGIQRQGMGMEGYARSKAAREVWERADAFTRRALGFSIVRVVRENPSELIVDGVGHVHPRGVLHLTQFTQVAMAVLAMAQVAELREAGVWVDGAVTCGHSVGEYNALAAIAGVLPLESVVEIVYQRGCVMHHLVPRDASGESGFRMGVIRPNCAGLDHAGAEALVAQVRERVGLPLEIVNYNVRGWQYSVTGRREALEALEAALEARRSPGAKPPYVEVPGVDVPFHSRVLSGGVSSFRETLRARLPERLDVAPLLGRYIPNLVPEPFSLERGFVERIFAATGSAILSEVLESFEDWAARPDALARAVLIELLAWQFASPVRWIETQELMFRPVHEGGLGVERLVEVGVGYQPTLVGMARATLRASGVARPGLALWNVEAHVEQVFCTEADSAPVEEAVESAAEAAPSAPVEVASAPVAVAANAAPLDDRALSVREALVVLLALQARVRPDQVRLDETIDGLFEGVSSRRNQVLIDLGAEFGVGAIDGAHELPIEALAAELERRAGGYKAPGAYLSAAWDEALTRGLGRARMRRRDVEAYLEQTWGMGPGWVGCVLSALTLETREGASGRGGALGEHEAASDPASGRALLDALAQQAAGRRGVSVSKRAAGGGAGAGGVVDAAAVRALEDRILGPRGVLAAEARSTLARLGDVPGEGLDAIRAERDAAVEQLAVWEREHGASYERLIRSCFEARKHVAMTSAWAWAQRDVGRLAMEAQAGRLEGDALRAEAARLAAFGAETRVAQSARWYAAQARARGDVALAEAMESIVARGAVAPASVQASRPCLEVREGGELAYEERPSEALAFVEALWSCEATAPQGWEGLREVAGRALKRAADFGGRTALVTGASPGSIAWETVRHLLRGGARVVVTTTRATPERLGLYRAMYQRCAVPGAELHVVPFNQASFEDVDALVEWLFGAVVEQSGAVRKVIKRPFAPDLVLPFGAMGDIATLDAPSDRSLAVVRAMLLGVERLVGAIGRRYRRDGLPKQPCHVVLPLSPNHGSFGGDGAYAETKAGLEVMLHKWRSERHAWGEAVTLCGARIGWVRGTGLMDANNPVAARLEERTGALTFSNGEMGWLMALLCGDEARDAAREAPLRVDVTGGFAQIPDVRAVVESIRAEIAGDAARNGGVQALETREAEALGAVSVDVAQVEALPGLSGARVARAVRPEDADAWPMQQGVALRDMVVIVGAGEVGPLGHARTRFEVEVEDRLSAAGVLELAWVTGLVRYSAGRWVDTETEQEVPEAQLAARYREQVRARSGIRLIDPEVSGYDPSGLPVLATVFLERDFTFTVASEQEARLFAEADPEHTRVRFDAGEEAWEVTRRAGAQISVPRKLRLSRRVAGLVPTGFDFGRYGVPPDMVANVDRLTLFNLVATVDAFVSAGISPEVLLRHVHPARVANTQGSGIGGMRSLRRLYVDHVLGEARQSDVLQETLINVVAAYVVQSYVGSYGTMSHPVAACATAAVSLEEGMDKILGGRAEFVVAGGFDDIGSEGALGFSDMGATADSDHAEAMGLAPHQVSRPNDARRCGFVEAQGGGTVLLARGDVALEMGLPVLGVLGWAGSFGDGIHKSIPAPGLGALAAAMGGASSPLGRALSVWGLSADDVALVYKHDTSTQANDPNENALHHRIQEALGRSPGNPLWAVSQKSITGHPKGGAAAWQAIGLCQSLSSGVIPGNRNLESVDEALEPWRHVAFTDAPLRPGPGALRAGLLTSLGFGHVGAVALLLHPAAFVAQLGEDVRAAYLARAAERCEDARRAWAQIWMGQRPAFVKRTERRFVASDGTAAQEAEEVALLLDPRARLDPATGRFVLDAVEAS